MWETIVSTFVGGLIASIPVAISAVLSHEDAKSQREHELRLKEFDLYERKRLEIIEEYLFCLGCLPKNQQIDDNILEKFFSKSIQLSGLVTSEIRAMLYEISNYIELRNGLLDDGLNTYRENISEALYDEYLSSRLQITDEKASLLRSIRQKSQKLFSKIRKK